MKALIKTLLLFSFFLPPIFGNSQEINQFDDQGKRHGKWMKKFEGTDQTRYEGVFFHGNETGTFRFYKIPEQEPGMPASEAYLFATRTYTEGSDIVDAKYFTPKGEVLSEGQMKNKERMGKWVYFHPNSDKIMKEENYVDGKLDGPQITYFPNGNITKSEEYSYGKLDGVVKIHSSDGKVRKYYTYQNGELNGLVKYFDMDGNLIAEGNYKGDKRIGVWKTYENGKVVKTEKF